MMYAVVAERNEEVVGSRGNYWEQVNKHMGHHMHDNNPHPGVLKDETWSEIVKAANEVPLNWIRLSNALDKGEAELNGHQQFYPDPQNSRKLEDKSPQSKWTFLFHRVNKIGKLPPLLSLTKSYSHKNAIVAVSIVPKVLNEENHHQIEQEDNELTNRRRIADGKIEDLHWKSPSQNQHNDLNPTIIPLVNRISYKLSHNFHNSSNFSIKRHHPFNWFKESNTRHQISS